jgi:hypothetical protein
VLPPGAAKDVRQYGAVGDGVHDDTSALRSAIYDGRSAGYVVGNGSCCDGKLSYVYLPAGTYLISGSLAWDFADVTIQGEGPGRSIIKLKDGTFTDASQPKPVLSTRGSNDSFAQYLFDLTVDCGDNPGAKGIEYLANNMGAVRNVVFKGNGTTGIDMMRQFPGPALIEDVTVEGFQKGVELLNDVYSMVFERLTLRNQSQYGILNHGTAIELEHLVSDNHVPALENESREAVVVDATLSGGNGGSAIENSGHLYVRNATTSGYGSVIAGVAGTSITEYVSGTVSSLFDSSPPRSSLNLPVNDSPDLCDTAPSGWVPVDPQNPQAAFDSGAATVYFPQGYYDLNGATITVPQSVRRVLGLAWGGSGNVVFRVVGDTTDPLIIERFSRNVAFKVEHAGKRPLAIKHAGSEYVPVANPPGDLYLDDFLAGTLTVTGGQKVWARQLNLEGTQSKITNNGGSVWVLGYKTEGMSVNIDNRPGGSVEMLGGLVYAVVTTNGDPSTSDTSFVNTDGRMSLMYSYLTGNAAYTNAVRETKNGVTRVLASPGCCYDMPLYVGY